MEKSFINLLKAFGFPGVALGLFYLLLNSFKLTSEGIDPIFKGVIIICMIFIYFVIVLISMKRFPLYSPESSEGYSANSSKKLIVAIQNRSKRDSSLGPPWKRILSAKKEVWLSGATLNVATSGDWRGFEKSPACVRVLLPNYKDDAVVRVTANLDGRELNEQRQMIKSSCDHLHFLKSKKKNIEIRLLDYCPSFSVFAVDPKEMHPDGYISVELTGYKYIPSTTANFTLTKKQYAGSELYNHFLNSWETMWDEAIEYLPEQQNT